MRFGWWVSPLVGGPPALPGAGVPHHTPALTEPIGDVLCDKPASYSSTRQAVSEVLSRGFRTGSPASTNQPQDRRLGNVIAATKISSR